MDARTFALLVGLGVFVICIAGFFVIRFVRKRRTPQHVGSVQQSFKRLSVLKPNGQELVRNTDNMATPKKTEGRGRFYTFGVIAAAILGTLFVRLWSLQIAETDEYVKQAEENMTSTVSTPANRGRILDRNGIELVGNRPSLAVLASKKVADNRALVQRLSLVLGIPRSVIRAKLLDDTLGVQSDRVIARDCSMRVVSFIKEHPRLFEDVSVETQTVRAYAYGSLAAHILGYTGPVTEENLKESSDYLTYESGDIVGRDGAESRFESVLQGTRGTITYQVDVLGNPLKVLNESLPQSGSDIRLTIDLELQTATDKILADVIASCHAKGHLNANAGALICIDVEDGGILAASSYPSYEPEKFNDGISTDLWEQLTAEESGYPLTNRVLAGLYPAASTFKAFVSLAGLENGVIGWGTEHECTGLWEAYGSTWGQRCWIYPGGHGVLGLEEAINQSCDVFFYSAGAQFYETWYGQPDAEKTNVFQDYLKSWGFGSQTGIDLPGESAGRVPDAAWKETTFSDTPEEARWQPGDMTNMSIGQGDILVTPLQICNGYAGIARRKMLKPHVLLDVIDPSGQSIISYQPVEPEVQPVFSTEHVERVEEGLRRVVARNSNFDAFPVEIAGKTGTAEVIGKDDYSWFVAYAPRENPKYCVACLVEQVGDGSSAGLLGVKHTLAKLYDVDVGEIVVSQDVIER
ncbi:MAG: penicillin-binding protein 2 [Coriobacteriales bacterium]|jgi:penicillin-binding protein 2|nr:penicillin-binding protein 2 [Coriobacteriales bacterium]